MKKPVIRPFFDEATNTVSYLIWDAASKDAAVIDPVLDWDNRSGAADTRSADALLAAAKEAGLAIRWVLETHAHADHLTAAPYIKGKTGAPIGIGEHIREVQKIFRPVFDLDDVKPAHDPRPGNHRPHHCRAAPRGREGGGSRRGRDPCRV